VFLIEENENSELRIHLTSKNENLISAESRVFTRFLNGDLKKWTRLIYLVGSNHQPRKKDGN
jgi:hypothetical protein